MTVKCLDVSLTIWTIKYSRVFFIGAFFTIFTSMIKFLFGDLHNPTTKLINFYSTNEKTFSSSVLFITLFKSLTVLKANGIELKFL